MEGSSSRPGPGFSPWLPASSPELKVVLLLAPHPAAVTTAMKNKAPTEAFARESSSIADS